MTIESASSGGDALHICALLPEVETALSTLQCAVAAARGFAAEICAAHVGFDARAALVDAEETEIQQLREIYEGPPEVRAARVKAVVDGFCATASGAPPIRWHDDAGDVAANVAMETGGAGLIVVSRPVHLDAADAFHAALFGGRRLVLVAPRDVADGGRVIGRHIVIGWKPGAPVEETAQAASPWLKRAEKITVLWAARPGSGPYEPSARAFFERLGVEVEIAKLARSAGSVGHDLIGESTRRGADCLLIGAYTHGAWWETMFGGVTRDVLAEANVPVFMMRAR
ncbi:universal stress protein [Rhodoblastus acidophilus]|uniref:Universal stress protein n=1 Tax=Candidatus Rhodoblastus alkanivorans TaxID=2954117 RepID=A0ABS9Z778_9HYPH|nr:universal stress protein [Candidatus Rhodoblastus alkanivorans]MCI4678710.1 universal stress protein [Candidatus Rhodoblastus alkanivorans]MCI4683494.1 universal stress protein [Candidatus Rhodoblastus alkanivorans]MDI4640808.1 universal stress protein [Rhodoblastus acidophilus]